MTSWIQYLYNGTPITQPSDLDFTKAHRRVSFKGEVNTLPLQPGSTDTQAVGRWVNKNNVLAESSQHLLCSEQDRSKKDISEAYCYIVQQVQYPRRYT